MRWRWQDVDSAICKDDAASPEPFFRESPNGTAKDRKRNAAV
jgi:hypothetical protein